MSAFENIWEDFWFSEVPSFGLRENKADVPQVARKTVEWNYVDGEEGDTGVIEYYFGNTLVATKTVLGGDQEDTVFTKEGRDLYFQYLITELTKTWKENG